MTDDQQDNERISGKEDSPGDSNKMVDVTAEMNDEEQEVETQQKTIDHLNLDHLDDAGENGEFEDSQDNDLQTEEDALESTPTPEETSESISPIGPPKRPQSAYFIFMQEKRSQIQQENPDITSIGSIAKIVGQMWKDLTNEERKPYQDIANEQKKLWQKEMEEFKLRHPDYSISAGSSKSQIGAELILPIGRIKKLCRLDPEVKSLSKDAVILAAKCAELFTEALANETEGVARIQKRKKLICQDIVDVCSLKERFFFLKEDMSDLLQMQKLEEKDVQNKKQKQLEATEKHENKKGTLDSFFKPKGN